MLNFLATPQTDTRTLERFILPAEKVAGLDFNSKVIKDFVARLKNNKRHRFTRRRRSPSSKQKDGDINTPFAAIADHMPPDVKRGFLRRHHENRRRRPQARYEKSYAKMVQFIGIL